MNKRLFVPVLFWGALSFAAWTTESMAAEGGNTHYIPGSLATMIDLAPTQPGWVLEPMYLHYNGNVGSNARIPVAGLSTLGLDASSDAVIIGGFYTLDQELIGAHYSVGAYLPYIWMDVNAHVDTAAGSVEKSDSASGFGDMTLIPAMFAWKQGRFQYNAALNISLPTGEYEKGRLANPGLNYWSFDPWVGVSYNNEKLNFNAALHGGIVFNTENTDTDYTSGTYFHIEGSLQKLIAMGKGFLTVGAEGYWVEQLEADSGQRSILGDFKSRTVGIGPVLGYIMPLEKANLVVELRWLNEVDVKNRLDGDFLWAKVAYQF